MKTRPFRSAIGGIAVYPTLFLMAFSLLLACKKEEISKTQSEPMNISTYAGVGGVFGYTGDGSLATSANLGYITATTIDKDGNIYVADGYANVIRKVDASDGKISTVAGKFENGSMPRYDGDGGAATSAHLNLPLGIAVAASGNIYIADAGNNVVRKVTAATGIITTFAGSAPGLQGYTGDGGPANKATFFVPYDLAVDAEENVYIVDAQNNVVRKIAASTGIITSIAGIGPTGEGFFGDGFAAGSAKFKALHGIAVDAAGNIYLADSGNHAVRKISSVTGIITTIAGSGVDYGYTGDGGLATAAKLYAPSRVTVDATGNVIIADQGNNVIRKISSTTGIITTIAGTGKSGFSGDGGLALSAELSGPETVTVDAAGNIYVGDKGNSVIRRIVLE
jgi:trimeric autotransporter adhesin